MFVERIQVEEGFLDTLDLRFEQGLNVLIGPRGTGKTSIIELIRYCLAVPAYTEKSQAIAKQHALSVLGDGRVTVTLRVGSDQVLVSRSAAEEIPKASIEYRKPVILSQNEIESVGLEAKGRLKIIDSFRKGKIAQEATEQNLLSQIKSLTLESQSISQEIQFLKDEFSALTTVPQDLLTAQAEEKQFLTSIAKTAAEQDKLQTISKSLAALSVRGTVFDRSSSALERWMSKIRELQSVSPQLEQWPKSADSEDALNDVRKDLQRALKYIDDATKSVDRGISSIRELRTNNESELLRLHDDARLLRRQLEALKAGATSVTRRVTELQEKAGQRSAIESLLIERSDHLTSIQEKRSIILDHVEFLRDARYQERLAIAKKLNGDLGPRIQVEVEKAGLYSEYVSSLSALMRGSRIHYNTLAPLIALRMSPRELVEAIEKGDDASIAEFGEVSVDRARNLISHVRPQGLEEVLTCEIEDGIRLSLLDGDEYKSTESLSTGQRCTVILPILLGRHAGGLIVDQPEDHLDNAFIVETLIQALKRRVKEEQLIFSTHNANIPVLGEADRVILLGSDGKRGFVRHSGKLDSPQSIEAITTVMEGGKEAFKKRATFYKY